MNSERRTMIASFLSKLQTIKAEVDNLEDLDNIKDDVGSCRDDEQEYVDNFPENMQGGERYSEAERAVESLDSAHDSLGEASDAFATFKDSLQEAINSLEGVE